MAIYKIITAALSIYQDRSRPILLLLIHKPTKAKAYVLKLMGIAGLDT